MSTSASHFFMSYSRENADLQRRVIAELRSRGIKVWVDVENLIPGSPAWEREIERSIREAPGVIVLMSPDSHNSEWVRREISFAEQNKKRIFPVLLTGDEHDSIPLRLSSHQRVDLRQNFDHGMDELANALREHLGSTKVIKRKKQEATSPVSVDIRKFVLPGLLALLGIACIGGLALAARFIYSSINSPGSPTVTPTPSVEPFILATSAETNTNEKISGLIAYTCQVNKQNTFDQICVINADGSGQRQLTDSGDYQDASFSPLGGTIILSVTAREPMRSTKQIFRVRPPSSPIWGAGSACRRFHLTISRSYSVTGSMRKIKSGSWIATGTMHNCFSSPRGTWQSLPPGPRMASKSYSPSGKSSPGSFS